MNEEDYIIGNNKDSNKDFFVIRRNVVYYSSVKSKRIIRSVFISEIYGCINGFDLRYIIGYTFRKIVSRLGPDIPSILFVICTNSYSLYECLVKFGTTTEKRFIIDIIEFKESYERREIEIRWINGQDNPADAMTKASPNKALETFVTKNELVVRLEGWI